MTTYNAISKAFNPYLWNNGKICSNPQAAYESFFPNTSNPLDPADFAIDGSTTPWGTVMQSTPGKAFGTMTSFNGTDYPDSGALCTAAGVMTDSEVRLTFGNNSSPDNLEVEDLCRMNYTSTRAYGYEIDYGVYGGSNGNSALALVLWNRTLADPGLSGFTYLVNTYWPPGVSWATGAEVVRRCVGKVITVDWYPPGGGSPINVINYDTSSDPVQVASGYNGLGAWCATGNAGDRDKFYWSHYKVTRL